MARVLALVTDAFGGHGGIARFNRDFIRALSRRPDLEIFVLARGHGPSISLRDAMDDASPTPTSAQVCIDGKSRYSLAALLQMSRFRPDFVFCGHLFMAPLAAVLARAFKVPFWLHVHGVEAWDEPWLARKRAAERAALITSVSRYTRSRLLEWAQVAPHLVRVLPNTVDHRFRPGPKPSRLVEKYQLAGRRVILTVARINTEDHSKGHGRVLAAVRSLSAHMPQLVYLIVGDGTGRPQLEATASELGLSDRVIFAGAVDDAELADYYRVADCFAMPSTKEGFGIVFIEAAASGIPVIGGAHDGSADALADGKLGTMVSPDDEPALVAAIETALRGSAADKTSSVSRFGSDAFQAHVSLLLDQISGIPPCNAIRSTTSTSGTSTSRSSVPPGAGTGST